MPAIDVTGQRFARLIAVARADAYVSPGGQVVAQWLCRCDCGGETVVRGSRLRQGLTRSCGCLIAESQVEAGIRRRKPVVSYQAAHSRVKAARGPASQHACAGCGMRAHDWSYNNADPDALTHAKTGHPYSLSPDFYLPLCRRCHRAQEAAERSARGVSKRRWVCGKVPGYNALHYRIRCVKGKAAEHLCECGKHANEWAYDGTDPNELREPLLGCAYSLDLDRYHPMCFQCHRSGDAARARRKAAY